MHTLVCKTIYQFHYGQTDYNVDQRISIRQGTNMDAHRAMSTDTKTNETKAKSITRIKKTGTLRIGNQRHFLHDQSK